MTIEFIFTIEDKPCDVIADYMREDEDCVITSITDDEGYLIHLKDLPADLQDDIIDEANQVAAEAEFENSDDSIDVDPEESE